MATTIASDELDARAVERRFFQVTMSGPLLVAVGLAVLEMMRILRADAQTKLWAAWPMHRFQRATLTGCRTPFAATNTAVAALRTKFDYQLSVNTGSNN